MDRSRNFFSLSLTLRDGEFGEFFYVSVNLNVWELMKKKRNQEFLSKSEFNVYKVNCWALTEVFFYYFYCFYPYSELHISGRCFTVLLFCTTAIKT